MKNLTISALLVALVITAFAVTIFKNPSDLSANSIETPALENAESLVQRKTLRAFRSERELKDFFHQIAEKQRRDNERRRAEQQNAPTTANTNTTAGKASESAKDDSVTNVQHAGVDEGGIVKMHGDHLVVLRRGRLFTVAVGDNSLNPISAVDAFGDGIDPDGTWYDEMLVSDDTVVVIGYSYQRGGTEVGLFDIDRAGHLRYRSTYHLRSNDYYSSRNYASRLIGNKLIFYTPLYLNINPENPTEGFPALRKWHKGATDKEFESIIEPTRIFYANQELSSNYYGLALHTVTTCDLSSREMSCNATGVLGAPGRVFYVSPESVYVWTTEWNYYDRQAQQRSMLYRMPLNGFAPSALKVSGSPVDQFSFLESKDRHLNVLVRSDGSGDGMWGAEQVAAGDVALMRVSLSSFSDGSEAAPASRYRKLPKPEGYTFQNRFIGNYLLYGTGSGWGRPNKANQSNLYAVNWAEGETHAVSLEHGVDRIEALGADAVIVGTDGRDLHFSSVRLGNTPRFVSRYTRPNASQGELRSHGFFYKPTDANTGLLGLPIRGEGQPGYKHLFHESASILFLRNDSLRLSEIGELDSRPEKAVDDKCRASCVDWYGNARPLFIRGRIIALLGYELVEGSITSNKMREYRRTSFAPRQIRASLK